MGCSRHLEPAGPLGGLRAADHPLVAELDLAAVVRLRAGRLPARGEWAESEAHPAAAGEDGQRGDAAIGELDTAHGELYIGQGQGF